MSISGTKNLTKNRVVNSKELNAGQTNRSSSGKFSALLDDAEQEKQLKEAKDKALENQEFVSAKLMDPNTNQQPPVDKLDE